LNGASEDRAAVIRLPFKWNDDTLLILTNAKSTAWLANGLQRLADENDDSVTSLIVGNGKPIWSPDEIEISIFIFRDAAADGLEENTANKFSWGISRETALEFAGKVSALSGAAAHQYLDPSNCHPAPVVMVSSNEYSLEHLLGLRAKIRKVAQ
jgi:hypothetical protein